VGSSRTHIVPLIVGDAGDAVALCEAALERGVFAQAIRPPTVPPQTSRLRLAPMASHSRPEMVAAARALAEAAAESGLEPARLHFEPLDGADELEPDEPLARVA
jgi:glycine C-acetyltransferase/8-amino-7-oxononanoate synthase